MHHSDVGRGDFSGLRARRLAFTAPVRENKETPPEARHEPMRTAVLQARPEVRASTPPSRTRVPR